MKARKITVRLDVEAALTDEQWADFLNGVWQLLPRTDRISRLTVHNRRLRRLAQQQQDADQKSRWVR